VILFENPGNFCVNNYFSSSSSFLRNCKNPPEHAKIQQQQQQRERKTRLQKLDPPALRKNSLMQFS
jgi:hypothetical protein